MMTDTYIGNKQASVASRAAEHRYDGAPVVGLRTLYSLSPKNLPSLRFSEIFSQTVGNY